MTNLIEAWGNYYFHTSEDIDTNRSFKIEKTFAVWAVYENIVDDINKLRMQGTLEECVAYCKDQGAYNYDPLAQWR